LALVREAWQLAQQTGDREQQLTTSIALVQAQSMTGALTEALRRLTEALGPEPIDLEVGLSGAISFNPALYLLMMRGHLHTEMGRLDQARADLERVLVEGRNRGEIELLGWAHEMAVYLFVATSDLSLAGEHAEQAVAIAEKIGSPLSRASAYYSQGAVHLACERWDDAVRAIERGLEIIREQRTGKHWEARGLALLAEALAGAGQHEKARVTADEAEAASLRNGDRPFECISCLAVARARLAIDGAAAREKIEASLDRLAAIIARSDARLHEPWLHELRAELATALGDSQTRQRQLRTAQGLFAAIGAEKHAARVGSSEADNPLSD
jgi:tetratricopeptide (TPR) repeat protein